MSLFFQTTTSVFLLGRVYMKQNDCRPHPFADGEKSYKAIEERCGKSTWRCRFSRLASPQCHIFEKSKKTFLDMVYMGVCVCIVFRFHRGRDTHKYTDTHDTQTHTSENKNIPYRLLASLGFRYPFIWAGKKAASIY